MTLHDTSITNRMQLEVKDLAVHYSKEPALKIDELSIEGTILAVIGHNGSGKSTFIKSLLELIKPKTGTISVSYSDGTTLIPERHMAFSPEHGAIFEDISVESYIRLWCDIKQKDSNYYKKAGAKFIESLELKELFPKMGRALSKGQRRRVQTAAGFMCAPKLFLFDEPFDGLDISQSTKLSNIMLEASKDICLLVSSHRMEVVERIADIIIVLKNGEAFSYGSLEKVCHDLCESCICISTPTSQDTSLEQLIQILKDEFSNTIINHVGNQVIISGHDISKEQVDSFLQKTLGKTFSIEKIRPPLMDAMQYHLEYGHKNSSTT